MYKRRIVRHQWTALFNKKPPRSMPRKPVQEPKKELDPHHLFVRLRLITKNFIDSQETTNKCCLNLSITQTVLSKETWEWARSLGFGLDEAARPWSNFTTSEASSRKYLALLGFLPTVQAKISGADGNDGHVTVLKMLSNMSSSDLSSPMHSTKSGGLAPLTMVIRTCSATKPLLIPCREQSNALIKSTPVWGVSDWGRWGKGIWKIPVA